MEGVVSYIQEKSSIFSDKEKMSAFIESLQPYIRQLKALHFSFDNPVFDFFILLTFIVLTKFWGLKKSFSYCLISSTILVVSSGFDAKLQVGIEGSATTYADIVHCVAIFIIVVITIYYSMIKDS